MFMLGRRWGLLGADIDAWDVSALRVRAAAIVMVVAVSAGLAWVNPTAAKVLLGADPDHAIGRRAPACPTWRPAWHTRPVKAAINDPFTADGAGARAPDLPTRDRPARPAPRAWQAAGGAPAGTPGPAESPG